MNLVPKLSMAFIAGMSFILAVNGYRRVRREVALFESDRIRDDVQIGKTLAAAVTTRRARRRPGARARDG